MCICVDVHEHMTLCILAPLLDKKAVAVLGRKMVDQSVIFGHFPNLDAIDKHRNSDKGLNIKESIIPKIYPSCTGSSPTGKRRIL